MSVNRSSSQVRNLRAMFENSATTSNESTSPDRGRSNGHLSPGPNGERPLSRVRSSFVSVEPGSPNPAAMEVDPEKTKQEHTARQESSAGLRRQSFSLDEAKDSSAIATLKKTISQEEERRGSNPFVAETIPEAAIEATPAATTPAVEAKDYMAAGQLAHGTTDEKPQSKLRDAVSAEDADKIGTDSTTQSTSSDKPGAMTLPVDDLPADNPDKPVSGVQEEAGSMQPSDLKERSAVSPSSDADPTPASSEQVKPSPLASFPSRARRGTITESDAAPAPVPHRPANIVTAAPEPTPSSTQPKTPTSAKKTPAPTSARKSPAAKTSSTLSPKPPVRKPSSSSLAQAKSKPDTAAAKTKSPQSKPVRPRSPTRLIKVSSHLTAPTAASAAKHDAQPPKAAVSVSKPAANSRPQARVTAAATKPTARSSLASTSGAPKKTENRPAASTKAPDEGFLARMMRPTASSASKAHEKTEVKSPPKRTPSVVRPKAVAKPKTAKVEKTANEQSNGANEVEVGSTEAAGASTPQAASGAQEQESNSAGLEATPAFDAATIR